VTCIGGEPLKACDGLMHGSEGLPSEAPAEQERCRPHSKRDCEQCERALEGVDYVGTGVVEHLQAGPIAQRNRVDSHATAVDLDVSEAVERSAGRCSASLLAGADDLVLGGDDARLGLQSASSIRAGEALRDLLGALLEGLVESPGGRDGVDRSESDRAEHEYCDHDRREAQGEAVLDVVELRAATHRAPCSRRRGLS
jgi:hypothetical protein